MYQRRPSVLGRHDQQPVSGSIVEEPTPAVSEKGVGVGFEEALEAGKGAEIAGDS